MRSLDPPVALAAIVLGVALIVVARFASRVRGSRADSWIALRIGDVLFTEMAGAFILAFAAADLFLADDEAGPRGPTRFGGRFGRIGGGLPLPFMLGVVAAALAALGRIDIGGLLLRGKKAPNTLSNYIGWDARVVAHIPAGGYGEIAMPDGSGNTTSVAATADTDLMVGTRVRITGTRDLNFVVERLERPATPPGEQPAPVDRTP